MKEHGTRFAGIEVGNAWDLRGPGEPTNWIVGHGASIEAGSLRSMPGDRKADHLAVKWFVHDPGDDPAWGTAKPASEGRTLSILAGGGEFELRFFRGDEQYTVVLDRPGDFALWGPGLGHSWRPLGRSTIMTCRWTPLEDRPARETVENVASL